MEVYLARNDLRLDVHYATSYVSANKMHDNKLRYSSINERISKTKPKTKCFSLSD